MQQIPHILACTTALLVIFLTLNLAEGKSKGPQIRTRGCALYGHSCFGGHGKKRSFSTINEVPSPEGASLADNPQLALAAIQRPLNPNLEIPTNYDNNIDEYDDSAPEQDFKYAVYGLFKQWMNDLRKARDLESRTVRAYEFLKQNSADQKTVANSST